MPAIKPFEEELKERIPNHALSSNKPKSSIRQTLEEARVKVCEKAARCKSDYVSTDEDESDDTICKFYESTGKYHLALKYGNRILKNIMPGGKTYLELNDQAEVDIAVDLLTERTMQGEFDESLEKIRQTNTGRKKK